MVIVDLAYFNEYSQRFYCALFSIPSDSKKELLLQTSFIKQYVLSDTGLDHVDIWSLGRVDRFGIGPFPVLFVYSPSFSSSMR